MNSYYAANLLVYAGVDIIALLALNLQFGVSGIVNFSFIVFQAVGAYTAAVLSMPPDTTFGYEFQVYFGGYHLPFPIPWIGGAIAGGLLAIPVGLVVLRKLRLFAAKHPRSRARRRQSGWPRGPDPSAGVGWALSELATRQAATGLRARDRGFACLEPAPERP